MSLNLSFIQESKFLLVLTLILLGWQVGFFFLYNYFRLKDENVKLNRVLLSYGFLIFMGMVCLLFLTIITLFIPDPSMSEVLRRLAYISALAALVCFWFFVSNEQFNVLVNVKITRSFLLLTVVLIVLVFFMDAASMEFRYILILILIEGIFLIIFQIRLIQIAKGAVKKRLTLITFGGILIAIAMAFGVNSALGILEISIEIYHLMFYLAFGFMMVGFIFLFVSVYNFPPILEFKWKESLLKLIIFNNATQTTLYSYDFPRTNDFTSKSSKELQEDESVNLFSGGIIGIDSIIAAITDTKTEKLNKIKQGNSFILLEYGKDYDILPLTYALIVKEDLTSIRYFLSTIRDQFESFYKEILFDSTIKQENLSQLFGSFEIIIKNLIMVR